MKKVRIEYTGSHGPHRIEYLNEHDAKKLVESGLGRYLDNIEETKPQVKSKTKFSIIPELSWKEKEIKAWMVDNNIDIEYNIERDTKKEILGRLSSAKYI